MTKERKEVFLHNLGLTLKPDSEGLAQILDDHKVRSYPDQVNNSVMLVLTEESILDGLSDKVVFHVAPFPSLLPSTCYSKLEKELNSLEV
jgi:hypothetical protein